MALFIKILNSVLILFALYMGIKQGFAMVSGKAEMLQFFNKFDVGKSGVLILGTLTIIGAILVLFPKTFIYGNFITAAGILFIIALELNHKDLKGAAIELPFLLLSLVILYLQHPLAKSWHLHSISRLHFLYVSNAILSILIFYFIPNINVTRFLLMLL